MTMFAGIEPKSELRLAMDEMDALTALLEGAR